MRRLISVDVKANIKQKKYKTNFLPSKLELECQKGVYLSFDLIFHLVGISSILVLSVKNRGGGRGICLMGKMKVICWQSLMLKEVKSNDFVRRQD